MSAEATCCKQCISSINAWKICSSERVATGRLSLEIFYNADLLLSYFCAVDQTYGVNQNNAMDNNIDGIIIIIIISRETHVCVCVTPALSPWCLSSAWL